MTVKRVSVEEIIVFIMTPPSHDSCFMTPPQEIHRRYEGAPDSAKTKALQTVIEMKVSVSARASARVIVRCIYYPIFNFCCYFGLL